MIVKCPSCEAKYKLDPAKLKSPEPKIRCKKCSTVFKAVEDKPAAQESAAPGSSEPPAAPAPAAQSPTPEAQPQQQPARASGSDVVVVGHDSPEVTEMVQDLLGEAGFEVVAAHDGIQALMAIEQRRPAVAILDVALPKMFGFEICEVIGRDESLKDTRTMLIAAIYDKSRYKRSPASLYGADDYIEKHRIPEELVDKVRALTSEGGSSSEAPAADTPPASAPSAPQAQSQQEAPAPAAKAEQPASSGGFDESTLTPEEKEDHEKAKRLARIIASDVALYNPDAMVEGLKNGNPMEALAGDIEEGRKLFAERVPAAMRGKVDYVTEALEQLFEKKRQELGISL